jgi:hypothetical protein
VLLVLMLCLLFLKLHTVTRALQNEALLWKIQAWECKKPPVDSGTFCNLSILVFYIPPFWKCLPGSGAVPPAVLMQEDSVKAAK